MKSFNSIIVAIKRRFYFIHNLTYKRFGKRSVIMKPLLIRGKKYISIGDDVTVRNGARIEAIDCWNGTNLNPQIVIGNNTSFEQDLHVIGVGKITIGDNCVFSARTFISAGHHDYSSIDTKIFNNPLLPKDVSVGDYCFIGMDVKIFPGVTIGKNVIVGANSIVMNDLPDYTVCVGCPAKPIKKYNFSTNKWERI